ncbi:DUF4307 domain-containing protein [Streptomyces sp. M19]
MATVREGLPTGRYGRSDDERADRTLKIVGAVLGAVLLGVIGWFGYSYLTSQDVNGRVIGFTVRGDDSVAVRLEVHKAKGDTGVCTVRALDDDHAEVGRKDFTFAQDKDEVDTDVSLRTTARATSAELVSCDRASGH